MKVSVNISTLTQTRRSEYASRFLFGGAMTAIAGIIAREYGPSVGGLFLAFPAIFPASATLIENHEKQKKNKAGGNGTIRGRKAAAVDAAGAAMGAFGLLTFAIVVWKLIPYLPCWSTLVIATFAWSVVSIAVYKIRDCT